MIIEILEVKTNGKKLTLTIGFMENPLHHDGHSFSSTAEVRGNLRSPPSPSRAYQATLSGNHPDKLQVVQTVIKST